MRSQWREASTFRHANACTVPGVVFVSAADRLPYRATRHVVDVVARQVLVHQRDTVEDDEFAALEARIDAAIRARKRMLEAALRRAVRLLRAEAARLAGIERDEQHTEPARTAPPGDPPELRVRSLIAMPGAPAAHPVLLWNGRALITTL